MITVNAWIVDYHEALWGKEKLDEEHARVCCYLRRNSHVLIRRKQIITVVIHKNFLTSNRHNF